MKLVPTAHQPIVSIQTQMAFDLLLSVADDAIRIKNRIDVSRVKRVWIIERFCRRPAKPHHVLERRWHIFGQIFVAVSERTALVRSPRKQRKYASQRVRVRHSWSTRGSTKQSTDQNADGEGNAAPHMASHPGPRISASISQQITQHQG